MPKLILKLFIVTLCLCTPFVQGKELTISAAASLNNAFKEIANNYQTKYPDIKVNLNFAASGVLLQQIAKGAPVDIFASADQQTMDKAEQQHLIAPQTRQNFIYNSLVIITPTNSTIKLTKLQQLDDASISKIAVGNPDYVPAGNYTKQALTTSQQWDRLQSKYVYTQNVRQALDYVARGEVDIGFVYSSDASIMPDKVSIAMPVKLPTAISYPIAITSKSTQQELAKTFIDYINSAEGQQILVKYGFHTN